MITAGSVMFVHQNRSEYLFKPKVGLLSRFLFTKLATKVFSSLVYYKSYRSAKKKMHLKMTSAEVVCCSLLSSITDKFSIEANTVDPEHPHYLP